MIEISIVRGILTLALLLLFITLVVWLYAKQHRHAFDAAARLPLEEDEPVDTTSPQQGGRSS